jgi:hypothetical protein
MITAQEKPDYSPKFTGYVRVWYQADFSANQGQYLVKQARLNIAGNVNEYAGYKLQVDFTRLGKLSTTYSEVGDTKVLTSAAANFSDILLDAAAILTPLDNLNITAGQFKVPFSTDNLRSDQNADFANRPFTTYVSPSMRDIGFEVSYKIKGDINSEFTAGSFNGSGFNKSENDKTLDYVLRSVISPMENLNISGNYYRGKSSGSGYDLVNLGFDYKLGSLFFDAEYGNKSINISSNKINSASFFSYLTYNIPLPGSFIKDVTPSCRYEIYDPNKAMEKDEVQRITAGLTIEFAKITFAHFRINYEKFDYKDGTANPDKLILELQTKF